MIARIIRHDEIPSGCRRIVAEAPELAQSARPGQFVHLLCTPAGSDPLLRRPLGIHSVDAKSGRFELVYEIKGRGTKILSERIPGENLDILGPLGNGFDIPESADQPIVLVGGGMGAVPLYFLADHIRRKFGSECMTFIMGACTISKFHFSDSFKEFCDTASGEEKYHICTDDGTCGHHGFVTDVLSEYLDGSCMGKKPLIYACGPTPMLKAVSSIAVSRSLKCQISMEAKMACGIGACMGCVVKVRNSGGESYVRVCKEGPVFDAVDVVWE